MNILEKNVGSVESLESWSQIVVNCPDSLSQQGGGRRECIIFAVLSATTVGVNVWMFRDLAFIFVSGWFCLI